MIIASILGIASGALMLAGSSLPELAETSVATEEGVINASNAVLALGIVSIGTSIVYLIIGILGWRGAKHPSKIGPFFWLSIIGAVLGVLGLVMNLFDGTSIAAASVIQVILVLVCVYLAYTIRKGRSEGRI